MMKAGASEPLAAAFCLGHKRELPPLVLQGETLSVLGGSWNP